MNAVTIFWFRRDLRSEDNAGFFRALKERGNVVPLFIFDSEILDKLSDKSDRRISFIYEQLVKLKTEFEKHGSTLLIRYGRTLEVFERLLTYFKIEAVYANHDYEPYATARDKSVEEVLNRKGV